SDHRGLTAAARTGQDDERAVGHGRCRHLRLCGQLPAKPQATLPLHSTFWINSRTFSSVALISTTCREIATSLALDPMVFVSRPISWTRNSSLRPGESVS